MEQQQAYDLLARVLELSDADHVRASLHANALDSLRVADNVTTHNVRRENTVLSVECAFGQSHASATTNDLGEASLRQLVTAAETAARLSPPDPEYMPPVTPEEAGTYPACNAWSEETATFAPELMAERVGTAIEKVRSQDYRLSGGASQNADFSAFANSAGLRGMHRSTRAEMHATVLGEDGSGWAQTTATSRDDVDMLATAGEALEIAQMAQHPTEIEPGRYTVILRPEAVREMLPHYMIQDAKTTDEGRTFLRGLLGTKVCDEKIHLYSDPANSILPGSPFCKEGLATRRVDWVKGGVLENLDCSRYWAREKNLAPTPGPTNLIMAGGEQSVDDLIASTERGIYVIRFWYIRVVDPMTCLLTGMTRDGLFLIEDGTITRPLLQFRFNERVLNALSNVEAIGPQERVGNALLPTLKIRDFNFSSATRF